MTGKRTISSKKLEASGLCEKIISDGKVPSYYRLLRAKKAA
jgi:hypothetical protein